jgi:hypothetical protein
MIDGFFILFCIFILFGGALALFVGIFYVLTVVAFWIWNKIRREDDE